MSEQNLPEWRVLADEWTNALVTTAYIPLSSAEINDLMRDLARQVVTALSAPTVDTRAAARVGARLVAANFTGPATLPRTLDVLTRTLPGALHQPSDPAGRRLVALLGGLVTGYAAALRDRAFEQHEEVQQALVSARRDAERNLQASEARFREVFESSPMGIAISELSGLIVRANPALDAILGYPSGALVGRDMTELFFSEDLSLVREYLQRLRSGEDSRFRLRLRLRDRDDDRAWVNLAVSVLLDADQQPQYLATMIDDITDLQLLKDRLIHQTLHDVQTGLPNRQYFLTHLEEVLGVLPPQAVVTLLHLDLDGFSAINEALGYQYGDRLLNAVGQRLTRVVPDQRTMVARVGSDEFAILIAPPADQAGEIHDQTRTFLDGASGFRADTASANGANGANGAGNAPPDPWPEPSRAVPNVGALAEAINAELAEPVYLGATGVGLTATIGAVQRPACAMDHLELWRRAGATLRRRRGRGKGQWEVYDATTDAASRAELRLVAALPGALECGELRVDYRPVMTLDGSHVVAVEAVLCWQHPELGLLSPERCTQIVEQTGWVYAVGQWLLRTAAEQAVRWPDCPLLVNLTATQAQDPDLVAKVRAVLAETRLPSGNLELCMPVEAIRLVTGLPAGECGDQAENNLTVLAELGVGVGVHEFAGGLGSLRCFADLPVRSARVAGPVSRQVADDPSRLLSQSVHNLVHQVRETGINVIAYPVDRTEQVGCWQWVGANWAVGNVYGRPGPAERIDQLLRPATNGHCEQDTPEPR